MDVMKPGPAVDGVCRFLFEQLVILFHNHECFQCQGPFSTMQYSALPLCQSVDTVLSHMKYCNAGMSCQIPRCSSVRVIMSHWKMCTNRDCPVALNISKDRKEKIQLLYEAEMKSFSAIQSPCQNMNKQLIFLFLTHDCEECAKIGYQHHSYPPPCHSVDTTLSHMKHCRAGMSCKVPGCPDARAIISHGNICKNQDCPVVGNLSKDRKLHSEKMRLKSMLPSVVRLNWDSAKNYRQTLFVMFHAWSCMDRQKSGGFDCDLPWCRTMQALIKHIETCEEDGDCKYPDCNMTRFIFIHYMACTRKDCEICWPVRTVIKQLCGTDDSSTSRPAIQMYEGMPASTATTSDELKELWCSARMYKWILTKDKPLIGPPLFQRENQLIKRHAFRRWKKRSRVIYSWMRKPPYRWRYYTSLRLRRRIRRNRRLSSL